MVGRKKERAQSPMAVNAFGSSTAGEKEKEGPPYERQYNRMAKEEKKR